jgi:hypothetical protein
MVHPHTHQVQRPHKGQLFCREFTNNSRDSDAKSRQKLELASAFNAFVKESNDGDASLKTLGHVRYVPIKL